MPAQLSRSFRARFPLLTLLPIATIILFMAAAGAVPAGESAGDGAARAPLHVVGSVTDGSGAPIAGAQMVIVGVRVGGLTDRLGRYMIRLESAAALGDSVTVEAIFIGYERQRQTAAVRGDTVRIDFQLAQAAIELQELVVTGAAAPRQARTFGFTIGGANASGGRGAASPPARPSALARARPDPDFNTEAYDRIHENVFLATGANPLSTFSIDVDRASYGNVRRFIERGQRPPADAVRIEELVNYFSYEDPEPSGMHPFSVTTEVGPAPWRPEHQLVRIGLQARRVPTADLPPANLVFLIDVSGSMQSPDKLPLLKRSFSLLVEQLREEDRVAIVVYAGAAGLVLPSTSGEERARIMGAIDRLEAGGSTAGGAGIRLAYEIARENFVEGGNNRVILATDGDFNVGASSDAEMVRLIEAKRAEGTYLTVLGFGTGNLKDSKMEKLADSGNGNYAYIDGLSEARKVLVHEMGGTLLTLARDVKIQVEFNPDRVAGYRLIGYENRLLRAEDFDDDAKDAGELGAGHAVTALYEVVPVGAKSDVVIRGLDSLRYSRPAPRRPAASGSAELGYVKLRYKRPNEDRSVLLDHVIEARATRRNSNDFRFAAAVAAFGMVLRESEHRGSASMPLVLDLASTALGKDEGGYRAEFLDLARRVHASEWTTEGNR